MSRYSTSLEKELVWLKENRRLTFLEGTNVIVAEEEKNFSNSIKSPCGCCSSRELSIVSLERKKDTPAGMENSSNPEQKEEEDFSLSQAPLAPASDEIVARSEGSILAGGQYGSRFDILVMPQMRANRIVMNEEKKALTRRLKAHQKSIHFCRGKPSEADRFTDEDSSGNLRCITETSSFETAAKEDSSEKASTADNVNQVQDASSLAMCPSVDRGKDSSSSRIFSYSPSAADRRGSLDARTTLQKEVNCIPAAKKISIPSKAPYRRLVPQAFSHILVLDFEATCDSGAVDFPHEIIEFPVVVLDTRTLQVVAEFHRYVQPTKNKELSEFCTDLTGITQEKVDAAKTIDVVLEEFQLFLEMEVYPLCQLWKKKWGNALKAEGECASSLLADDKRLITSKNSLKGEKEPLDANGLSQNLNCEKKKFVFNSNHRKVGTDEIKELYLNDNSMGQNSTVSIVSKTFEEEESMICFATDGPWDMRKFMFSCEVLKHQHEFPPIFYRFINVRQCFTDAFKCKPLRLTHMLSKLQMSFEGRRHSGIDDTRNICRILAELLARGYRIRHVSTIKYRLQNSESLMHEKNEAALIRELELLSPKKSRKGGNRVIKKGKR